MHNKEGYHSKNPFHQRHQKYQLSKKALHLFQVTKKNIFYNNYFQYFFELPETNKKLFYASDICDVFGAMGSWNDSPPCYAAEKGLENEYNNLSSELLTQIRLALLYSVNEW